MQQQHSQTDGLFSLLPGGGAAWESVDSILQTLEDQQSLLTGMFKQFVSEAQQGAGPSRTTAAAAAAGRQTPASSSPLQGSNHQQQQQQQQQPGHGLKRARAPTELPLSVTLEDLFHGALKTVPVQLRRQDARTGAPVTVVQQLQVCVQPGLHAGTRITLPGAGSLDQHGQQSDLTFVVQQQLHPDFRRLADDLYAIVSVPLVTALTGGPVELKTLSGHLLQLPVGEDTVITPNSELVLQNQGMPVFGDRTGKRGALHVRFRVCFPQHLGPQQQQLLRQALAEPSEQQQVHVQVAPGAVAAAAVATMAGLQPRPTAGLSMLPPSPTAALQEQSEQQEQQQEQQQQQQQRKHAKVTAGTPWAVGGSSWLQQQHSTAAAGLSGSPGSSSSACWTAAAAAVADSGGVKGGASAFLHAAGVAAASINSSSSAAGLAASMQSTGSSREAWVFGNQNR